jgi:hypothetical protein
VLSLGAAGVVLREAQALSRETINVRRLDLLLTIAAKVTVAEVVGEDEDDVGLCGGCYCCVGGSFLCA